MRLLILWERLFGKHYALQSRIYKLHTLQGFLVLVYTMNNFPGFVCPHTLIYIPVHQNTFIFKISIHYPKTVSAFELSH